MPFSSRYIALLLACLSSCALAQQPPAELARKVSAELGRCTKALKCEVNACASNGGLKSCYGQSNALWDQAIAQLEARLDKKDGWCATYWAQLKDAQAKFAQQASQVKSLGDGPYNTDDDLALLLYQQQYELAYSVAKNSACK